MIIGDLYKVALHTSTSPCPSWYINLAKAIEWDLIKNADTLLIRNADTLLIRNADTLQIRNADTLLIRNADTLQTCQPPSTIK